MTRTKSPFAKISFKLVNAMRDQSVIFHMNPRPTEPLPVCISFGAVAPILNAGMLMSV